MRCLGPPRFNNLNRWKWLTVLSVTGLLLLVYLPLAASELTWANNGVDGGDLVTAVATLGIPHPTGYPTYVLLGRLFLVLPVGEVAHRVTLLSAVSAAMAGGLLSLLFIVAQPVRSELHRFLGSALVGLALGLSPLLWSQAVIAEVHGLNALFIVLVLWLVWRLGDSDRSVSMGVVFLGFSYGLGLGNHVTMILMAPVLALVAVSRWRLGVQRKWLLVLVAGLVLGLAVYLYLPLRARANPAVNWGDPSTWEGFLWMVTARPYGSLAFALPLTEVPRRLSAWAGLLIRQFTIVGVGLGVVGLAYGYQRTRWLNGACLWMILAYSAFSIGYDTADSYDYLIPAYIGAAWFIGQGMLFLMGELSRWHRWAAFAVPVVFFLSLAFRLPGLRQSLDPRNDRRAVEFTREVRTSAPENALIHTWSAADSFPLWYEQFALGHRPDLRIVVVPLTQFGWYRQNLRDVYPDLAIPPDEIDNALLWTAALTASYMGPVCRTNGNDPEAVKLILECP